MSNETKNKVVPKLRFPEFKGAGEWQETTLGKLGELVSGLTYSPDDVRENGLLVLRSSNIKNGKIVLDDCVYVRSDIKGANLSKANDILICVRNGSKALIGKNAIIPEGLPHCTHGAFMTVFRANIPNFVHQLFQTDSYNTQVSNDLGATINSINGGNFIRYKFYVPEPEEQQKIADCLSSLDELITAQSQKLQALKAHKKGLMQQLFPAEGETVPKLRFAEFKDSAEWEEKTLGELLQFKNGINASKELYGKGIKFINVLDILQNEFITHEKIIGSVDVSDEMVNNFSVNYGDILFQRSSETQEEVGTANVYLDKKRTATFGGFVIRGKKIGEYEPIFLNKLLKTESIRSSIISKSGGSTRFNIGQESLSSSKIFLPTLNEQVKIADCFSSLDEQISAQTARVEALKTHKKGLMQALFPQLNESIQTS